MTWIIGFSVSVVVGLVVVWVIHDLTHKHLDVPESQGGIPPWLLGVCERAFFTLVIAFNPHRDSLPRELDSWTEPSEIVDQTENHDDRAAEKRSEHQKASVLRIAIFIEPLVEFLSHETVHGQ